MTMTITSMPPSQSRNIFLSGLADLNQGNFNHWFSSRLISDNFFAEKKSCDLNHSGLLISAQLLYNNRQTQQGDKFLCNSIYALF